MTLDRCFAADCTAPATWRVRGRVVVFRACDDHRLDAVDQILDGDGSPVIVHALFDDEPPRPN